MKTYHYVNKADAKIICENEIKTHFTFTKFTTGTMCT